MNAQFAPPDFPTLRRQLAEAADHVAAAIADAANRPSPERLERVGIQLHGVARLAQQLHAALPSEGGPPDAT